MHINDWIRVIFGIITGLPFGFSIAKVTNQMKWNEPVSWPLIMAGIFFFVVIFWFWYTERQKSTIESGLIGSAILYSYVTSMFVGSMAFTVLVKQTVKVGAIAGSGIGVLVFFILSAMIISRIYEKQNS